MLKTFLFFFLFFSLYIQIIAKEKTFIKFENNTSFLADTAFTLKEKKLGLSFSKEKDNFALLFVYDKPQELIFWMKDMNFAIDILWIQKNQVVWIEENIRPSNPLLKESNLPTYGHNILADKVLELPAGTSRKHKIKTGMKVYFTK